MNAHNAPGADTGEARHSAEYVLPEGMTAEKLRRIAYWFDLHDKMASIFLTLLEKSEELGTLARDAKASVEGTTLQDDCRRWARLIDGEASSSERTQ